MNEPPLEFSQTFCEIAKAMLKAQEAMGPILKSEDNPYFGSKYADLANVLEVVGKPLNSSGILICQGASTSEEMVHVETKLLHASSGEWVRLVLSLKPLKVPTRKDSSELQVTPQSVGSAITYARRYGLQAICGIAPEDDDGNAASQGARAGTSSNGRTEPSRAGTLHPKEFIYQGIVQKVHANEPKGKEKRCWFGEVDGRTLWTREPEVAQVLVDHKGTLVVLTLLGGTKPNVYQVMKVEPVASAGADAVRKNLNEPLNLPSLEDDEPPDELP